MKAALSPRGVEEATTASVDESLRALAGDRRANGTPEDRGARVRALADTMPQIEWTARPNEFPDGDGANCWRPGPPRCALTGADGVWATLHPDDVQACLEAWYHGRRKKEPYHLVGRFRDRRTGAYRWHLACVSPSKGDDGRVQRWTGTWSDIHEHTETQRLLEQQVVAAREADRRKTEFLAKMAHEFRSPLAAITSAVELLPDAAPEERQWAENVIARQTGHLVRLIEDLLDVSRIDLGKIRLRKQCVDLATVLDHAVETVRPTIDGHRHQLAVDYPRDLYVEADPARLEQVFVNLLINAAKYTPPGGHVSLRACREDGEFVVRVCDDGLGISPENLADIFQLFAQGEHAMPGADGGLGLGLAIVQQLAELHGGTVSAASPGLGHGSEFTVRLPALEAPRL